MTVLRDTGVSTFLHCCPKPGETEASAEVQLSGLVVGSGQETDFDLTLRRLGTVETITRALTKRDTCLSVSLLETDERIW